jgi:hypothetical protein
MIEDFTSAVDAKKLQTTKSLNRESKKKSSFNALPSQLKRAESMKLKSS